jgi:hypothetical protein
MNKLLLAGVAALALSTGAAVAQTTIIQTGPAPAPPVVAPPEGTLSVTHTQKYNGPNGTSERTETTYRKGNGVADDTVTRTTENPPPPVTTTTTTTTNSSTTTTE